MALQRNNKDLSKQAEFLSEILGRLRRVIDFNHIQTYPRFDNPNSEERGTSFQVLVQIIISLRATLEKEREAARKLFAVYSTPDQILETPIERIEELIKPAGMHKTKAATIVRIAGYVMAKHQGDIDKLRELPAEDIRHELLGIKGVGPKAADCMLELGFGIPYLPVDVNVDRVSRRLGLASMEANKEEVRLSIEDLLPEDIQVYIEVHTYFLGLGKYYCKAVPLCVQCPVADLCPFPEKTSNGNGKQLSFV